MDKFVLETSLQARSELKPKKSGVHCSEGGATWAFFYASFLLLASARSIRAILRKNALKCGIILVVSRQTATPSYPVQNALFRRVSETNSQDVLCTRM